jgi:hypothetical protein
MSYDSGGNCWNCGAELSVLDYGRSDTCRQCGRDTKVCKGCIYYEINSNNECRESQAERVVDKERSNFCDFFKPSAATAGKSAKSRDLLKSAAEALFKK